LISTINDAEILHFSSLSTLWWDQRGELPSCKGRARAAYASPAKCSKCYTAEPASSATATATAATANTSTPPSLELPRVFEGMPSDLRSLPLSHLYVDLRAYWSYLDAKLSGCCFHSGTVFEAVHCAYLSKLLHLSSLFLFPLTSPYVPHPPHGCLVLLLVLQLPADNQRCLERI
jgi:hypothetical protein